MAALAVSGPFTGVLTGKSFHLHFVRAGLGLHTRTKAIREVEAVVETMRAEHDPLASYIYVSRRQYRNAKDTKGGKRREINARLSFNTACELGFRGSLDEWERLMSAVAHQ